MDTGVYGPQSVTWRLTRERALLLGGGRALLLQLAHPLVAAGVDEHSAFPADAVQRLYRTLDATLALVYGTTEEAERSAAQINKVHSFVHGTLPEAAGRFPAETPYDARDPDLLLWVHATLIDTTYQVFPRLVGPVPDAALDQAYEESKTAARMLGVPDAIIPADLKAFRAYMGDMLASDAIAVAPFQQRLGHAVLYPPIRFVPKPVFWPAAALTVSLLPDRVRRLYGFELSSPDRVAADWSERVVRGILPLLPRPLRWLPHARRAYERVGAV